MKTMSALKATATISAGIALALLTVQGTLALWNVTATSKSQTVQSADFKVTVAVDGGKEQRLPVGGNLNVGGPANLAPGKSAVTPIVVTNATDAGGTFTVQVAAVATATGDLAPYLISGITVGRGGNCAVPQRAGSVVLPKGASETLCLATALKENTPATFGGTAASITVVLTAEQQSR